MFDSSGLEYLSLAYAKVKWMFFTINRVSDRLSDAWDFIHAISGKKKI